MLKTKLPELGENQSENIKNLHEYFFKVHEEIDHHLNVLYGKTKGVSSETKKIVSKAKLKGMDV